MDFVKNQLVKIQQHLAGLSPSQRMLAASLVAILVLTLLLWNKYAGNAEMESLLPQAVSPDELSAMTSSLTAHQISYRINGGEILVPAEQKYEAMATLMSSNALPDTTYQAFDKMVQQIGVFASSAQSQELMLQAKSRLLSQILSRNDNIERATVVLGGAARQAIGSKAPAITASINIKSKGRRGLSRDEIQAAGNFVRGAIAGLTLENVTVSVDGRYRPLDGANNGAMGGMEQLELIDAASKSFSKIIETHLSIPGARAQVGVEINDAEMHSEKQSYDREKSLEMKQSVDSQSVESTQSASAAQEPGAAPNTQVNLAGGGPGGDQSTSTESREKTQNMVLPASEIQRTHRLAGKPTPATASVIIPRSYLIREATGGRADAKEPDAATLATFENAEVKKLQQLVMHCVMISDPSKISITFVADDPIPVGPPEPQVAGITLPLGIGGYAKEIAVVLLALISVFMVSMMVRKSTPPPIITVPEVVSSVPAVIEAGETVAGEVASGDMTLDGMELDEDAVKTQQMQEQVATMVKENPDAAAVLVKRWLNR